jgi:hypothetical protein
LQENGTDNPLATLRSILQKIEAGGVVDYTLGGHACSRPPAVQQGKAPDSFTVSPDEASPLMWRPQVIQAKNLKGQTSLPTSCIRHWKGPPWSLPLDSKIQKTFCCDCFVSIQGLIGSHHQGSTLKSKTLKSLLSEFWLVTVTVYTLCNTCIWHITTLINISTMPFIMIIST